MFVFKIQNSKFKIPAFVLRDWDYGGQAKFKIIVSGYDIRGSGYLVSV